MSAASKHRKTRWQRLRLKRRYPLERCAKCGKIGASKSLYSALSLVDRILGYGQINECGCVVTFKETYSLANERVTSWNQFEGGKG